MDGNLTQTSVPPTAMSASAPVSSPTPPAENPGGKSKGLFILLGIIVIVVIAGGAYYYHKKLQTYIAPPPQPPAQTANVPAVTPPSAPSVTPVTATNVDQTLNNTDSVMQQTINQAGTDLKSIDNIDKSQDSTSGL